MNRVTQYEEEQQLTIKKFSNEIVGSRLMSMGFLPGCQITIERIAPLRGGFCLKTLSGQKLALRYQEADTILVE